jgi:hypothetical protein
MRHLSIRSPFDDLMLSPDPKGKKTALAASGCATGHHQRAMGEY